MNNVDPDGRMAGALAIGGSGLAGVYGTGTALSWNPVGWVILGGAVVATAYVGYKTYQGLYFAENQTAQDIISQKKKGTINREFPREMYDKTIKEIEKLAEAADKAAQTAKSFFVINVLIKVYNRKF